MSEQVQHRMEEMREMTARELAAQLGEQFTRLMKEESALAKAELFASARKSLLGGVLLTAAAVAGGTCWLVMVAAAIAGIAAGLPVWAAALIIGGTLGATAAAMALIGIRRLPRHPAPLQMTIGSLRELGGLAAKVREQR